MLLDEGRQLEVGYIWVIIAEYKLLSIPESGVCAFWSFYWEIEAEYAFKRIWMMIPDNMTHIFGISWGHEHETLQTGTWREWE